MAAPGFNWNNFAGSALSGLGQGLMAAGSPQGWSAFGPAFSGGMQDHQRSQLTRQQMQQAAEAAEREQLRFEEWQRTANQERADRERLTKAWEQFGPGLMGGGGGVTTASDTLGSSLVPVQSHGGYGAATGGARPPMSLDGAGPAPVDTDAQGSGFTPAQMRALELMPIEQRMQFVAEQAFAKPEGASSGVGKIMDDYRSGLIDEPTRDALLKKETYIAPPAQGAETWSRAVINGREVLQSNRGDIKEIPGVGGGPFEGNAMDAQASNILLTGNPASPEYAAAYAHLAQPKVQFDPTTNRLVTVSPDLSWAAKPGQQGAAGGNGGPLPLMPGVTGNRAGPTVQNAQSLPQQSQPTIPGAETLQVPGATITSSPGTGLSPADRSKIRQIRADADSIKSALSRFKEVVQSSDWRDDLSAYGGGMTEGGRRLNSTYNSAALLTKAESLFNLGVLNGPDLELIRRTLPDPSTLPGMLTSEGASGVAVDEIISLIDNRLAAFESQYGGGTTTSPAGGNGGAPSGGTRVDQLPAGNWQ